MPVKIINPMPVSQKYNIVVRNGELLKSKLIEPSQAGLYNDQRNQTGNNRK